MRKIPIALAALLLAACNSGTAEPDASANEAGVDDSVNLATDVAPTIAATDGSAVTQPPAPEAVTTAPIATEVPK